MEIDYTRRDISLSEFWKKTETNPLVFKQKFTEIKQSKPPAVEIITDGSKDKNKVAAAAVVNHDFYSVFWLTVLTVTFFFPFPSSLSEALHNCQPIIWMKRYQVYSKEMNNNKKTLLLSCVTCIWFYGNSWV